MTKRITSSAVLCAISYNWIVDVRQILDDAGAETIGSQSRDETIALLQSHTFKGMITVSSWLLRSGTEDEAIMLEETPLMLLIEETQRDVYDILKGPRRDWCTVPFDRDELVVRLQRLGMLPQKTTHN